MIRHKETMYTRILDTHLIKIIRKLAEIDQMTSNNCVTDHNRSKRRCIALTSSDLKVCYEMIVHTSATLILLHIGIPHSKIHSLFLKIQRIIHRIRTYFGNSDITYWNDEIGDWENYP